MIVSSRPWILRPASIGMPTAWTKLNQVDAFQNQLLNKVHLPRRVSKSRRMER